MTDQAADTSLASFSKYEAYLKEQTEENYKAAYEESRTELDANCKLNPTLDEDLKRVNASYRLSKVQWLHGGESRCECLLAFAEDGWFEEADLFAADFELLEIRRKMPAEIYDVRRQLLSQYYACESAMSTNLCELLENYGLKGEGFEGFDLLKDTLALKHELFWYKKAFESDPSTTREKELVKLDAFHLLAQIQTNLIRL